MKAGIFIRILFQYIIALSSLSVMVATRKKIGQSLFLPWRMYIRSPFTRTFMRFFMAALLYLWVRIFFIIEVKNSPDPAPFDPAQTPWELLTVYGWHFGLGAHILLYYFSYVAVVLGIIHILFLEIHYLARNPISEGSLGDCYLSAGLKDRKILGRTIDKHLIWCAIEPLLIMGLGFLSLLATQSYTLLAFFIAAGTAMVIQGQWARLRNRAMVESINTGKSSAETVKEIHDEFREKKNNSSSRSKGEENEARIA